MAPLELILLRPVQRALAPVGLKRPRPLGTLLPAPLARGYHSSLTNTSPMLATWRKGPLLATKTATEQFSMSDNIQSRIPVLAWQTGYSYYNNYSSRKPGVQSGLSEISRSDTVNTAETGSLAQKVRDILARDYAASLDSAEQHGIRAMGVRSDGIALDETLSPRHGLWSIYRSDALSATVTLSCLRKF